MCIMNVLLSKNNPNQYWSQESILSYNNQEVIIHLNNKKNFLDIIQIAARKIQSQGIKKVVLLGKDWDKEKIWFFWQGYRDAKRKNKILKWPVLKNKEQNELINKKEIIDWVCNTINLPSNELYPLDLVNKSIDLLKKINKNAIQYSIIEGDNLLKNKYMGIYQVGNSSINKPVLLKLDYNPNQEDKTPVFSCLVGKGITFDTGGYNLKNNNSIKHMKSDMAGAATLVGSLALAIKMGLKKRTKLYICCAENVVSHNALKIGDTISYRNGKIVEVNNTDAEGRLVLADGLIDACKDNPEIIIDAATLTGASKIALGNEYQAFFTFDKILLKKLITSAKFEKELFWQLPLSEFHRDCLYSDFYDLSNISNNECIAGASTAAAFLSYFIKNYKNGWIHIDCSASYQEYNTKKWSVGATGIGVKTISNLLINN